MGVAKIGGAGAGGALVVVGGAAPDWVPGALTGRTGSAGVTVVGGTDDRLIGRGRRRRTRGGSGCCYYRTSRRTRTTGRRRTRTTGPTLDTDADDYYGGGTS